MIHQELRCYQPPECCAVQRILASVIGLIESRPASRPLSGLPARRSPTPRVLVAIADTSSEHERRVSFLVASLGLAPFSSSAFITIASPARCAHPGVVPSSKVVSPNHAAAVGQFLVSAVLGPAPRQTFTMSRLGIGSSSLRPGMAGSLDYEYRSLRTTPRHLYVRAVRSARDPGGISQMYSAGS